MTKTAATKKSAGTICLYGSSSCGAGWLANAGSVIQPTTLLGTGEPVPGRSMTEAVWAAIEALRAAGITAGTIDIFEPSGRLMATIPADRIAPYFGDLPWRPATVYTISEADLIAASEKA